MKTSLISSAASSTMKSKSIKADQPQRLKSVTVYFRGRKMTLMQRPQRRLPALLCRMLRRSWNALFGTLTRAIGAGAMATIALNANAVTSTTLPTGGVVQAGQAAISQAGNQMTVNQSSNKAIIDWQSFSIGSKAGVNFVQPDANSMALNRVVGNDPSIIMGSLTANGKIFLINAAGVLVGKQGKIDVAGFTASTLNISNDDFLGGKMNFAADAGIAAGNVKNKGSITTKEGGSVYLLGTNVENDGIITSPGGEVLLAAGSSVKLVDTGLPGVSIDVSGSSVDGKVTNLGQIVSAAGRIGIGAALIDNSGTINASSVEKNGGRIFLRASKELSTNETSKINADGVKGGNVVLYSDHSANINGDVSVLGAGGHGGYVDTSGKTSLSVQYVPRVGPGGEWYIDPFDVQIVNTSSVNANTTNSGGTSVITSNGNGTATIQASTISATLSNGTSVTIATGATGSSGVNGDQSGDITVSAAITKNGGGAATLTLDAARNININAAISDGSNGTSNGGLGLVLNAGYTGPTGSVTPTSTGAINVTQNITVGGGIHSKSATFNFSGGSGTSINLFGASNIDGTFNMTGVGGTLNVNAGSTFNNVNLVHGTINTHAASSYNTVNLSSFDSEFDFDTNVTVGNLIMSSGMIYSNTGTFTITNGISQTGNGTIEIATGNFTQATGNLTVNHIEAYDSLTLHASSGDIVLGEELELNSLVLKADNGKITQTAALNGVDGAATSVTANATTGITLTNASNKVANFSVTNTNSGNISLNTSNALALGAITNSASGASVNITSASNVVQAGAASITADNLNVRANGGIVISNAGNTIKNFSATNTGSGDISLNTTGAVTTGTITNTGNVSLSSTGAMTVGAITSNLDVLLNAGGAVTQSGAGIAANRLNVTGVNGITLNNVNNNVNEFSATNTGSNNIALTVNNNSGLTLNAITNNSGGISIVNNNGGITTDDALIRAQSTVNLTATAGLVTVGAGGITAQNVNLTATGSGHRVEINGIVTASDTITLRSDDRIQQSDDNGSLRAATLNAIAGAGGVGLNGSNNVRNFSATTSAGGRILLDNAGDLVLGNVNANGVNSTVNVSTSGRLEVAAAKSVSATGGGNEIRLTTASETGTDIVINGQLTTAGLILLASNGAITQGASAGGISASNLDATANNGITLSSTANNVSAFAGRNNTSGNIVFNDAVASLALSGSTSNNADNGNISITNTNNITASSDGDSVLRASKGNVTLTSSNGSVALGNTIATNLNVRANAGISQQVSTNSNVSATANLTSNTSSVTLGNMIATNLTVTANTSIAQAEGTHINVSGAMNATANTGIALNSAISGNVSNHIANFTARNNGTGNITLVNSDAPGVTNKLQLVHNAGGNIRVENTGAMETVGLIDAPTGSVTLITHSPLTIGAGGLSAGTGVTLTAGDSTSASDTVVVNGVIRTTAGSVAVAGNTLTLNKAIFSPTALVLNTPNDVIEGNGFVLNPAVVAPPAQAPVVTTTVSNTVDQSVSHTKDVASSDVATTTKVSTANTTLSKNSADQTIGGSDGEFGGSKDEAKDKDGLKSNKPLPVCT